MAQRRSRNRRLSARRSNVSDFLNEDTNVYDNNDPLWYDRTAIRPSTSLRLSKNTTTVLDPDSTVHVSQLSDNWYENLSQSSNSRHLQEVMKNRKNKQSEEQGDSDHRSATMESESEHEVQQKKRANLRAVRKPSHTINKSAFMKALEMTTDSHTKNLTHAQMLEGNESESTHDESRTVTKMRPKFTRHAKNNTNNFDKALESDSASERPESNRSLRSSSKRISEINEDIVTSEKQKRLTRSTAEKIIDASHGNRLVEKLQNKSANKSKDKIIAESSTRELRNRSIVKSPTKSAMPAKSAKKSSSTKKRSAEDKSPDASSSSPEVKKHKRSLFSQRNKSTADKSKGEKSAFDTVLDSVNDSQNKEATITEVTMSNANEQSKTLENNEDSDSSSIPKNIRTTRSRSLFGERNSGGTEGSNSSKSKSKSPNKDLSQGESQTSKDKSAPNQSSASNKPQTNPKDITAESSDDKDIYDGSLTRSKTEQEKSNKSANARLQILSIETSDNEDIYNPSAFKQSETNKSNRSESTKLQISSINTSDQENIINASSSRIKQKETNMSKKSLTKKSTEKMNESRKSKSTLSGEKDDDVPTSLEVSNRKSRSHLSQQKNASKDENAFDQISFNKSSPAKNNSKEIEDTSKLLQRASSKVANKSQTNQTANASESKFNSRESRKNDSKADQSEDETSTIPQNIRRTRSRLFQKSKAGDDNNVFQDALDAENAPADRSELNQKSKTLNKSTNRSDSMMRDARMNRSVLKILRKKPKVILEKVVPPAHVVDPLADSSKENQKSRRLSPPKSAANSSLNKEKSTVNLRDATNCRRSIETFSDGTPAPMSPKQASTPFAPPVQPGKPSKRTSKISGNATSAQDSIFDDLLHTPNPAQSTLNPHGKPVNRLTQFSLRTFADFEERIPPAAVDAPRSVSSQISEDDVDVTGESEVSNCPLISRQLNNILQNKENTNEEPPAVIKSPKQKKQIARNSNNINENDAPIDWEKARQHTDAVKVMVEAQMRLAEEAHRKHELMKQRINAKLKRLQAQKQAEFKRKNKKPVDKAFLVDGKVYKQPKLPRPKSWATDKLYKHLWKCMEPKYGRCTRVKSEKFMVQLADFATKIAKRKKFENYKNELDDIMMTMARLGIIETRWDFYRFTSEFMPSNFIEKVNPMMMPGNKRNIPYYRELVKQPLLGESRNTQESDTDES